jgi:hypothetical protein
MMKLEGAVARLAGAHPHAGIPRVAWIALVSGGLFWCMPALADPAAPSPPAVGAQAQPAPGDQPTPQPVPPGEPQPMPVPPGEPQPVPVPPTEPTPAPVPPGGEEKTGPEAATAGKHRPEPYFEDMSWFNLEILTWIIRPGRVPPLATLGTPASRAVIGADGTTIGLAENAISTNLVGGRATYGRWFNAGQKLGFEASVFATVTPELDKSFHFPGAPDNPVLGRAFINALTGLPDALIIAAPGIASGSVSTTAGANLEGGNLDILSNLKLRGKRRTDLLIGPTYLHLGESLEVDSDSLALPGTPLAGTRVALRDRFATENHIYGAEIGVRQRWHIVHLTVDLMGKLGVGINEQEADISGSTTVTANGVVTRTNGGFLAQPTNSGHFSASGLSAVPQFLLGASYEFTKHLKAIAGYNFIYASNVVRPGATIDTHINPSQLGGGQLTGPAVPAFRSHSDEFSAQGLSAGLQWAY